MSDKYYKTTDLGLAAFLSARGHRIVGIGGVPPSCQRRRPGSVEYRRDEEED